MMRMTSFKLLFWSIYKDVMASRWLAQSMSFAGPLCFCGDVVVIAVVDWRESSSCGSETVMVIK